MKEKIYVEINGIKLGIVTEDGAEYVEQIARDVESKLQAMLKGQKNCTLLEASLFTTMSLHSKSLEDDKRIKNLETQLALYQANVHRLRVENEELRTRLAKLS
ncbi:MAG: cell division protein ZapA [Clostridia bacterium]|nr:cell division protein ZapA [Clostridia bacterium]